MPGVSFVNLLVLMGVANFRVVSETVYGGVFQTSKAPVDLQYSAQGSLQNSEA